MPENSQPLNPEIIPEAPSEPMQLPPTPVVAQSALPEAVQAIKRIEQRNNTLPSIPTNSSAAVPPTATGKRTHLFNFIPWTGRIGILFKVLFAGLTAVIAFFLVMILLTLTSIDTSIIKLSLSGTVTDSSNNQPITGAVVAIDGQQGTTGNGGVFSVGGLSGGTYTVHVTANGYESVDQQIALTRGFLNYNNTRQFSLKKSGIGSLSGKLISPTTGYSFVNDRIVISGKDYKINDDGTFNLTGLVTGKTKFEFKSINFKDEVREFQLNAGEQAIPDITLTTAGDAVAAVKSWIREDLVLNLKVTVEGVDDQYIGITSDGTLRVRDLEVGKEYKLRTEYPGYETRDYTIKIAQGENQLFNFKVVEKGFIPFLRKVGDNLEVFAANYDGSNEVALTTGNTQPYGEYIEGKNVYFMSTRDGLYGQIGGATMLAYVVSLDGGNAQRLTTNTTTLGRIIPNFKAAKLANVRKGTTELSRVLEIMNLQGGSRNVLETIPDGTFDHVEISDDGTTVWYAMHNKTKTIDGMYRILTDSTTGKGELIIDKPNIQVISVSPSGDKVLFSATNSDTGLQDLFTYTYSTKQETLIKSAYTGTQYDFLAGSEDKLIFMDTRDGISNLYMYDLASKKDTKLSSITTSTEGVEAVFQQSGYVLYRTNKALYVIDVNQPKPDKVVTSNVARYTGHDF